MFQRIKPKRISDEIFEQIKQLIIEGVLKPGDKLPPERELAAQMGVSRPTLREAINKLEAKGFLEQVQGGGTYVKSLGDTALDNAFEEYAKKKDAILEIMEVRKILETWAAYTAAERITEDELKQLEQYLNEMEVALKDGQIGYDSDADFHSIISYATKNIFLIHIMNTIYQWIEKISFEVRKRLYNDYYKHDLLYKQHKAIFVAIKNQDPLEAYNAMLNHMNYVLEKVKEIISEDDSTN
ncbi:FadR/GntR family transcriptional regulator [Deferribacter abyssi]|uniref:FadR/GntR family transcriptional regulator n=1 Tax=Deferribacter abyssi TaxID=213806 RepID=UPI003C18E00F